MPQYQDKKRFPYSCEHMFQLVQDVRSYPLFLPGCQSLTVTKDSDDGLTAEVTAGLGPFQDTFISDVRWTAPSEILIDYDRGPLRHLKSRWRFHACGDKGCDVEFEIDFEFKNSFFQKTMNLVFYDYVKKYMSAFEDRAKVLYS